MRKMREIETRMERPNELQKAVIIDMMKSVGVIAVWLYLNPFWGNFV